MARLDAEPLSAPLSERNASYAIDVSLDQENHRIEGHQVVRYRNLTSVPMDEIRLHLYLNGFKNPKSTFMKESGGQLRGDRYKEGRWGYIDLTQLRMLRVIEPSAPAEPPAESASKKEKSAERGKDAPAEPAGEEFQAETPVGPVDLLADLEFISPDDGNLDDQTVVRIPLPFPVPPGATLELEMAFEALLPRVFARTGYAGSFHMVGQWFPKLGVFQADDDGAAWNCHQFHGNSEFFSDYGIYDVRITVSSDSVVGACGSPIGEPEVEGDRATHHYRSEDVHDFSFAVDPDFRSAPRPGIMWKFAICISRSTSRRSIGTSMWSGGAWSSSTPISEPTPTRRSP